ncbi:hypothetical protein [Pyxidicoccus xibeiensis]|uniref:hypothetical protein n=1 Tax=Pyxidicoccus xibeiensis TaxID=2906759 RepID=UPI0020A7188A|nr:hypothetical protein [Pyxidicoccus xibeiensis]MCP3142954.1 hypothetical protein [Pyxidicoccus xibeiensis]
MPSPRLRGVPGLLLVAVLVVNVPGRALAADDFDRYFSSAVSLYENLSYERALEQLSRAKRFVTTVQQDVSVAIYEGLVFADLLKRDEALAAFHTALSLDPEAKLPAHSAPKVKRDFETVRARVHKELAKRGKSAPKGTETAERGTVTPTDRPERSPPPPSVTEVTPRQVEPFVPTPETRSRSRVPVVPAALLGAGVVAAGVGTVFGLSSRSDARSAEKEKVQLTASKQLEEARGSARTANILFLTAGAAATGALVTWLLSSRGEAPVTTAEVAP